MSERRDLNPRPSPWQGDALPLSYFRLLQQTLLSNADANLQDFFNLQSIFQKKMMNTYKLTLNASGETVEGAFDKEFCQKFREVAQSYVFCLENYY